MAVKESLQAPAQNQSLTAPVPRYGTLPDMAQNLTSRLELRLSPEEAHRVEAGAEALGMGKSAYIRYLLRFDVESITESQEGLDSRLSRLEELAGL